METKRGQVQADAQEPVRLEEARVSSEVYDFLERPAPWLLRSGTTVLAVVLGLLLILSLVIKYPDTIVAPVTITGTQPVAEVVARQSGQLESLLVREGQHVKKGDILAVVQSPLRSATVLSLTEKLARVAPAIAKNALPKNIVFEPEEGLGQIQDTYADFLNAYQKLRDRLADDYETHAGALLREQLKGKEAQIASLQTRSTTGRREIELAREKFDRSKKLHKEKLISTELLQEHEGEMLEQMAEETEARRDLTESQIDAAKLKKDLRDLAHERAEELRAAREDLRKALHKLQGEIAVWASDYVLRAPAEGVVAFYDFWSDQQYVTSGKQVFLIVPNVTQLLGRMLVSQGGGGKIKPGQSVRVHLDDFPYKEFGIVSGKVQSVSLVARQGANLVLVDIPHPLYTSFRRQLNFKQDMTGEGRIVTEDIRLLWRVLYEIRRAFVNNVE